MTPEQVRELRGDIDRWRRNDVGDFVNHDELVALCDSLLDQQALLRDCEAFIDQHHTKIAGEAGSADCPACGLVARLRTALSPADSPDEGEKGT